MPRNKWLAFYSDDRELLVEELGSRCWGCSCEIRSPLQKWDIWIEATEDVAKLSVLRTAQNKLTNLPFLEEVEWRDLSDMLDENWEQGMADRRHPGIPN